MQQRRADFELICARFTGVSLPILALCLPLNSIYPFSLDFIAPKMSHVVWKGLFTFGASRGLQSPRVSNYLYTAFGAKSGNTSLSAFTELLRLLHCIETALFSRILTFLTHLFDSLHFFLCLPNFNNCVNKLVCLLFL